MKDIFFAHIEYSDGDLEDVPVRQLDDMMRQTSIELCVSRVGLSANNFEVQGKQVSLELEQVQAPSYTISEGSERVICDSVGFEPDVTCKSTVRQTPVPIGY